jgi:tetratricopeptide (TPR) repeat protein
VWQSLFDELKDHGLTVLAVAMDRPDTARPWIEAAAPAYPCPIDRDHHLADLYNLVNVPQALWIDERGRIVRPPETAGSSDGFRAMDRKTFAIPDAVIAERNRIKTEYFAAVRDWVLLGPASANALDQGRAAARLKLPDAAVAEAHARYRLGLYLLHLGQVDEAQVHLAEAIRLHPDSWTMWRQAAAKNERGLAAGPEFWARVDALGERHYYEPADIAAQSDPAAS